MTGDFFHFIHKQNVSPDSEACVTPFVFFSPHEIKTYRAPVTVHRSTEAVSTSIFNPTEDYKVEVWSYICSRLAFNIYFPFPPLSSTSSSLLSFAPSVTRIEIPCYSRTEQRATRQQLTSSHQILVSCAFTSYAICFAPQPPKRTANLY